MGSGWGERQTPLPRFALRDDPDLHGLVTIGGPDARHITGPLRLRRGDRLSASRPGRLLDLEIVSATPDEVLARVVGDEPERRAPSARLTLIVALPKGSAMDLLVEKATEIGVVCVQPVLAHRCVARVDGDRAPAKLARWRRIAEEARKQCGRTVPLEVRAPLPLREAVATEWARLYVFHELASEPLSPADAPPPGPVAAVIGPEGGLTDDEVAAAEAAGGMVRRLGSHVLKCETAAIAAAALLCCGPWVGSDTT